MQILKKHEKNVHTNTYIVIIFCVKKYLLKHFIKDLLKWPKIPILSKPFFLKDQKTLSYTATQLQLNCKPNPNLAHPWTPKKILVEVVKNDMSIKEVTKTDKIEWTKIINVADLD